jgi:hypothetical protein
VARECEGIGSVPKVYVNTKPDALQMYVTVDIRKGCGLWDTTTRFQQLLAREVEYMTAFNIVNVSVDVRRLIAVGE